ncbi:MAG: DUF4358 domain-containing protein [Ruminococcus sp.]|nr:DUF4358 domain-containing protein [Ruminococcus sp.]MCM1381219.1 DUF4358 domain-containing protein [Muribaculaceae bacterium]MCM1478432.1 DUF4358 domain-containing protein [Muribaculaceae bacterium]
MKKSISVILSAIIAMAIFTACKNVEDSVPADGTVGTENTENAGTTGAEVPGTVTAADITAAVMAEIEIPSAVEKTAENIGAFYDVDAAAVEEMSVFICGSGAYPDELAVFKFSEGAEAGAAAVQKRLDSQIALYTDYTPDEVYKLEGANLIQKGDWVILTICADNSRAAEIINGLI